MAWCFVYITVANLDEAKAIGRSLVEAKLAACVNILPKMHSIYMWEGALAESEEAVLIAKTTETQVAALRDTVRERHSYAVPCMLTLPVVDGNADYLSWLEAQLR